MLTPAWLLPLSGRSPEALAGLVKSCRQSVAEKADLSLDDLCRRACAARPHEEYRLSFAFRTREELLEQLDATGEAVAPARSPRVAFVFSGQGSQRPGMGRQLLEEEPLFRETVLECDRILKPMTGWSVTEELSAPEGRSRLDQTEVVQPALVVLQVALAALWNEWGVVPAGVVGHSVGEIAAAHAGGALTLEEALRVACHRGRLMQRTTGLGKMAAVALSSDEAREILEMAGVDGRVSIAARNAPGSTVLSGDTAAVEETARLLESKGIAVRMLPVNYAFHSAQMEPILDELSAQLERLRPSGPTIPLYSTVRGGRCLAGDYAAGYWPGNVRKPVLFGPSVAAMLEEGYDTFLEIGPHPVLGADVTRCIEERGAGARAFASLRRGQDERLALLRSLGELYASGIDARWDRLYPAGRSGGGDAVVLSAPLPSEAVQAGVPRSAGPAPAQPSGPPAGDRQRAIQESLSKLIARVLGSTPGAVGVDVPMIDLGLDSLGAAETRSRAERELGLKIPLSRLLGDLTIAHLAAGLAEQPGGEGGPGGTAASAPAAPLKRAESRAFAPLSEAQKGLWVIYKLAPTTAAYNSTFAARIASRLDPEALHRAFQGLVDRHPSLRSTFAVQDGRPMQTVHRRVEVAFDRDVVPSLGDDQLRERMIEEGRRPFDLGRGPVMRVRLYSRSAADHTLLVAVHHIVYDRWSLTVMLDDLRALYAAELSGDPSEGSALQALPPLDYDYLDFVAWQSGMLAGPEGAALWDYWKGELAAPLSPTTLPADRNRPPVESYRGASVEIELDAGVTGRLRELAHRERKTLYTTLVGAFQLLLHHYSGQEDVVINSPMFGLRRPEFQRVVGDFINPIVLRTRVTPGATFREQLERTAATVVGAIEHQEFPYQLVIERLRTAKVLARTDAFRVMFNLVGEPKLARADGPGTLPLDPISMPLQEGQFDLACRLVEGESSIRGNLAYATDLYDRQAIVRMAEGLRLILERIVEAPGRTVAELCAGIEPLVPPGKAEAAAVSGRAEGSAPAPAGSAQAEAEAKVVAIWKEVLGKEAAGPDDSFFDLGGDSLGVLQVQDRLGQAFGREIAVMELFKRPTVAALAAYFTQPAGTSGAARASSPAEVADEPAPARSPGSLTEKELRIRHRRRWRGQ